MKQPSQWCGKKLNKVGPAPSNKTVVPPVKPESSSKSKKMDMKKRRAHKTKPSASITLQPETVITITDTEADANEAVTYESIIAENKENAVEGKSEEGEPIVDQNEDAKSKSSNQGSEAAKEKGSKRKIDLNKVKSKFMQAFEPEHVGVEPSVVTINLTKKYGKTIAVNRLNLKFYHGEIFALLG